MHLLWKIKLHHIAELISIAELSPQQNRFSSRIAFASKMRFITAKCHFKTAYDKHTVKHTVKRKGKGAAQGSFIVVDFALILCLFFFIYAIYVFYVSGTPSFSQFSIIIFSSFSGSTYSPSLYALILPPEISSINAICLSSPTLPNSNLIS